MTADLVDSRVAARYGWPAEPFRPCDQDLHILTLQAGTGRLLATAALRRPPASAGAPAAQREPQR